jgi:uncharacterized membrane protein YdfJ with MMPL/SSD domain
LTAGERVRAQTRCYSAGMIAGTLGLSAAMNAFGFASQADTLPFKAAGVVFGLAVPAAIYVLMRQAATHYLDAHKRSWLPDPDVERQLPLRAGRNWLSRAGLTMTLSELIGWHRAEGIVAWKKYNHAWRMLSSRRRDFAEHSSPTAKRSKP